jgi:hypothetical protein
MLLLASFVQYPRHHLLHHAAILPPRSMLDAMRVLGQKKRNVYFSSVSPRETFHSPALRAVREGFVQGKSRQGHHL